MTRMAWAVGLCIRGILTSFPTGKRRIMKTEFMSISRWAPLLHYLLTGANLQLFVPFSTPDDIIEDGGWYRFRQAHGFPRTYVISHQFQLAFPRILNMYINAFELACNTSPEAEYQPAHFHHETLSQAYLVQSHPQAGTQSGPLFTVPVLCPT